MSEESVRRKKPKKSKSKKGTASSLAGDSVQSIDSATRFPEDPEGGLYGSGVERHEEPRPKEDVFEHQF